MKALGEVGVFKCGHVVQESLELQRNPPEIKRVRVEVIMPCAVCEPERQPVVARVWRGGTIIPNPPGMTSRATYRRVEMAPGSAIWVRP